MTDLPPVPASIEYHLVPADHAAAAVNALTNSREGKEFVRRSTARAVIIFVLLGLLGNMLDKGWDVFLTAIALALLAVLHFPRYIRFRMRRIIEKRAVAGLCPCAGGRHRMTASDEGLRVTCDAADTLRPWSTIVRVDESKEHVFIVIRSGASYPVLRETMLGGDLGALIASLRAFARRPPATSGDG